MIGEDDECMCDVIVFAAVTVTVTVIAGLVDERRAFLSKSLSLPHGSRDSSKEHLQDATAGAKTPFRLGNRQILYCTE